MRRWWLSLVDGVVGHSTATVKGSAARDSGQHTHTDILLPLWVLASQNILWAHLALRRAPAWGLLDAYAAVHCQPAKMWIPLPNHPPPTSFQFKLTANVIYISTAVFLSSSFFTLVKCDRVYFLAAIDIWVFKNTHDSSRHNIIPRGVANRENRTCKLVEAESSNLE